MFIDSTFRQRASTRPATAEAAHVIELVSREMGNRPGWLAITHKWFAGKLQYELPRRGRRGGRSLAI